MSQLDARHEARSPPGSWRVLAAALICWGFAAPAISIPGMGATVAASAAVAGLIVVCWYLLTAQLDRLRRGVRTRRMRRGAALAVSLLAVSCAMLTLVGTRVSNIEYARADPTFAEAARLNQPIQLHATLSGYPKQRSTAFGDRAWVRISAHSQRGSVPMLLWLDEASHVPAHWAPGITIEVEARLLAQPPGDAAAYTATAAALRERATPKLTMAFARLTTGLRYSLRQQAAQVPGAELVPGFAVGDTSLVSNQLDADMLESSLSHLTAVSGSNTGLVVAAAVWCVARLGGGRRLRLVVAAAALTGFVLIVGPDASVQRATVMAGVLLVAGFGGRRAQTLPALGVAIIVLLALDPWQALQPGFSLSVLATGGILLLAPAITAHLRRVRLPSVVALPLAVALAAQLACAPVLVLLQPGIPAIGVIANLIAAPAAPIGTGVGLLAMLAAPVSPQLAEATVYLASLATRWVAATAQVCAHVPGGRWGWPSGWAGAALLAGCECALLAAWALRSGHAGLPGIGRVTRRALWQQLRPRPQGIPVAVAALVTASATTLVSVSVVAPIAVTISTPRDWVVVACDVGQGDAILIRAPAPAHEVMLVDTGEDDALLERCLQRFGVSTITLLVLSHDDQDHVGALPAITDRVEAALISRTLRGEQTGQRSVVQQLEAAHIPYRIAARGDRRDATQSAGLSWRVLAPDRDIDIVESNAASLIMLVQAGSTSVLLLGDTGFAEQAALRGDEPQLRAQVLKVAHHGSRFQDHTLPNAVRAQWALISVGADNSYGHPTTETLASLARAGSKTLRTDLYGSVALIPQADGSLRPWVERHDEHSR